MTTITTTIPIDLPDHIAAEWEPVGFRLPKKGENYLLFTDGGHSVRQTSTDYGYVCRIILRRKAVWPEWPEWLTDEFAFKCRLKGWLSDNDEPRLTPKFWQTDGNHQTLETLARHTNIQLPTYDGPWEHSLIRNPHRKESE